MAGIRVGGRGGAGIIIGGWGGGGRIMCYPTDALVMNPLGYPGSPAIFGKSFVIFAHNNSLCLLSKTNTLVMSPLG